MIRRLLFVMSFFEKKRKFAYMRTAVISLMIVVVFAFFGMSTEVSNSKALTFSIMEGGVVVDIELQKAPSKLVYGATLDLNEVELKLTYITGSTEVVHPQSCTGINSNCIGKQMATYVYEDYSFTRELEVIPRQVTGIRIQSATNNSVTITWDVLSEADGYEVNTSEAADGDYATLDGTSNNTYTITGLTQGKEVFVKIRAFSSGVSGDLSEVYCIAPKPDATKGLKPFSATQSTMSVTWENNPTATAYGVYYKLHKSEVYILAGKTKENSFTIENLQGGTNYDVVVTGYGGSPENYGEKTNVLEFGTAPTVPTIKEFKAGDKRLKLYFNKSTGAKNYKLFVSEDSENNYQLAGTISSGKPRIFVKDDLLNNKVYYVKLRASREKCGVTLASTSVVYSGETKACLPTSVKAKFYSSHKKFKKGAPCKKYSFFKKNYIWSKSFIMPGEIVTNVAGFNSTNMVPQSIIFAGDYILESAYDLGKKTESVLFVFDKSTKKYITTVVMPHKGHIGGMAYDGENIWLAYSKKLQCLKYSIIDTAAKSKKPYYEVFDFTTEISTGATVSYVAYAKKKLWAGTYCETASKYMNGYTITSKKKTPKLKKITQIMMPDRTQGVAFYSDKLIISRSCQTKAGRRGFLSQLDTYKIKLNLKKSKNKLGKKVNTAKMPPMNEGIAVSGGYTYVTFESVAFYECSARLDRIMSFKTSKIVKKAKSKKTKEK